MSIPHDEENPEQTQVEEQAEVPPAEVIDLVSPPDSPPHVVKIHGATKSNSPSPSVVSDSIRQKTPVRDPDRARREQLLTSHNVTTRVVQIRISKLVVPCEKCLKQARTWNALRGACAQMCGVVKSDQAIPLLHESLCRWMTRMKRPIPAGILRKIKEQISGFAKLRGERLFEKSTGWSIHETDCSLS